MNLAYIHSRVDLRIEYIRGNIFNPAAHMHFSLEQMGQVAEQLARRGIDDFHFY